MMKPLNFYVAATYCWPGSMMFYLNYHFNVTIFFVHSRLLLINESHSWCRVCAMHVIRNLIIRHVHSVKVLIEILNLFRESLNEILRQWFLMHVQHSPCKLSVSKKKKEISRNSLYTRAKRALDSRRLNRYSSSASKNHPNIINRSN